MSTLVLIIASLYATGPSLVHQQNISMTLPASYLNHELVQEQILSGLTTTFIMTCRSKGRRDDQVKEVFRIDIRFEPWDEVYIVDLWQRKGGFRRETLAGHEALAGWWRDLRLFLVHGDHPRALPGQSWSVQIELLPFSQSESKKAVKWLAAGRIPANRRLAREQLGNASSSSDLGPDVVTVMLSTSIQREVLLRKKWHLEVPLRR